MTCSSILSGSMILAAVVGISTLTGCQSQPDSVMTHHAAMAETPAPALQEQYASTGVVLPASSRVEAPVTTAEVVTWSHRGWTDEQIIEKLDQTGSTFHLGTSDELRLRDAGVSDEVVRAMKASAWK